MNNNKELTAYLGGPIEDEKDHGIEWREHITTQLESLGIKVYDPCKLEPTRTGMTIEELKEKMIGWKRSGNWELFHAKMGPIRRSDIKLVKKANMVIVYIEGRLDSGGTISENAIANDRGIPIYCVLKGTKTEQNCWALDTIIENGEIFPSFNQLVVFLKEKYNISEKVEKDDKK